jgi:hypothetical protein
MIARSRRFPTSVTEATTRSPQHRLNLMLWIKLFPCLGYFPGVDDIPSAIVAHVRQALSLPEELVPAYDNLRTLYRHHHVIREYYQVLPYGKDARRVAIRTILRAVRTMGNPADMILEVCVFWAVAAELKAGDLSVDGSERFADYRAQLLPWEACQPMVAQYCQ